jgi:hypothetical protein
VSRTILVVVAVLAAVTLAVVALRLRKLRRDERRLLSRPVDRRLMSPPPSPYQPSQGFRLLDGADPHEVRPTPPRPRLEPSRDYIFSELSGPAGDERPVLPNRHNADWALARSQHRAASAGGGLRLLVVVIVLVAGASVVGYALRHRATPHAGTTTTTAPTTTTTWPASFVAVATSAANKTATYSVPSSSYVVNVTGAAGAVWTVYRMGAANTLEFQGTVASGHTESLRMTGPSQVTLGSPHNARVSVGGSPVTLPTPLSAPLTLFFTPAG